MHWRLKAAIQAALAAAPGGEQLHYFLQRRAGGLRDFDAELRVKVDDGLLMLNGLRRVAMNVDGSRFVEIGTGWYPTLPLLLYVVGAREIHTFDIERHLRSDLTVDCARGLEARVSELASATGRDAEGIRSRASSTVRALARGASLEEATNGAIRYRAPADASATGLADGAVDVVFSNDVLEHVPERALGPLFAEGRRILRPGGVVFHSVNCGDHYAYGDRAIHQLNYLRYSDEEWAKYNNRFLFQNRLRAVDFLRVARAAGFAIENNTSRAHPKRLAELATIAVHPQFSRYTREQLAITSLTFVGRRVSPS